MFLVNWTIISFFIEGLNNEVLMSPPHNNALLNQRESLLITQPSSIPSSPLASPGAHSSTSFCLQSPSAQSVINITSSHENDDPTTDPNWQATKPTVRERNAAMFNNELMADIKFVVGCDGELLISAFFKNVSHNLLYRTSSNDPRSQICAGNWLVCVLCNVLWRTRREQVGNLCTWCGTVCFLDNASLFVLRRDSTWSWQRPRNTLRC